MKHPISSLSVLVLTLLLTLTAIMPVSAASTQTQLEQTARFVQSTVSNPQVATTGGEWAVIGLARSGQPVPQSWYETYLTNLTEYTRQCQGVLSTRKYTEYSRVVLALTALGEDPRNVAGYDLLAPLEDVESTVRQGINGAIYALIALDSGNYVVQDGVREQYLAYLLAAQLPDGGWALAGDRSDPDITAQALQALAPYRTQAGDSVERGLATLDRLYADGSFVTLESYAQTIIAQCTLGEDPSQDLLDRFFSYGLSDGSFRHRLDGQADGMATEQALCALAALARSEAGQSSLYAMSDVSQVPSSGQIPAQAVSLLPTALALLPICVLGQL